MIKFPKLPLEDGFADVLGKAQRGLGMKTAQLAEDAGISLELAQNTIGGAFNEGGIRALSHVLGLRADRVIEIANENYIPADVSPMEGLAQFNTPFGEDMTVNAYLVWDPESREAAAFDTGTDCSECLDFAKKQNLIIKQIFLTHTHGDHIFDLDRLKEKTGAVAYGPESEPLEGAEPFAAGKTFSIGALKVETRATWGHSQGGITYVIRGLSRDLAMVGDAIFAGSMGGGNVSYKDALETNQKEILSLSETTIICPGHGPLTTVGDEKRHNPFF